MKVTSALFMADGIEYVLPMLDLKASGSATVKISDALSKAARDMAVAPRRRIDVIFRPLLGVNCGRRGSNQTEC